MINTHTYNRKIQRNIFPLKAFQMPSGTPDHFAFEPPHINYRL